MAGSYGHVTDDEGRLLSNEDVVSMLENGGDVYEAVEEMYGMIWWLAYTLAEERGEPTMQVQRNLVESARVDYLDGIETSPGRAPE